MPSVAWDREFSGFSGSLWDCWQQVVQGKVVGLRWVAYNPGLAGSQGRLQAGGTYVLPRNDGPAEYVRVGRRSQRWLDRPPRPQWRSQTECELAKSLASYSGRNSISPRGLTRLPSCFGVAGTLGYTAIVNMSMKV